MSQPDSSLSPAAPSSDSRKARPARLRLRRTRGFTLVELLVAMTAGAMVSYAAFAFAKAATTSFQEESRMANATVSSTLGFRRLVSDLQRAAYMSTSNIQRDFRRPGAVTDTDTDPGTVCVDPAAYPAGIRDLAGIYVEANGYDITGTKSAANATNGTAPDRVTLAGNFPSTEQFWARRIVNGTDVYLEPFSGPVVRTNAQILGSSGTWETIFQPGRILRVVDQSGFQHFGIIASATLSNNQPLIRLTNETRLFQQGVGAIGATNPTCTGIGGYGEGTLVNVISRIRYEVRDLRNVANYALLYGDTDFGATKTAASISGDDDRHELVRYEINATDGSVVAGTEELISEYAVDLRFGGTVTTGIGAVGTPTQAITRLKPGDATFASTWAVRPSTAPAKPGPERIRSVEVRLAVRSRLPDRDQPLVAPAGSLYRFQLANGKYARVRTLQADVALTNQLGVFW
jgi:prepilin-type N-terminal cleavage/methylation domain-containing protein